MKSKILIEKLKEIDPTGEIEVLVGNCDILTLQLKPMYWDGHGEVFIRDKSKKGYDVIGLKVCSSGNKIDIQTLSIEDVIWNDPKVKIDLSELEGTSSFTEFKSITDKTLSEAVEEFKKYDNIEK